VIDIDIDTYGFDEAAKAIERSFPKTSKQRSVMQLAMRDAGRQTALVDAALRAAALGGSGSLGQALTMRNRSLRAIQSARVFSGVELVVKRHMKRAIKTYEAHYGVKVKDGIRHGHLVEFGVPSRGIPARSFLWAASEAQAPAYVRKLSTSIWDSIKKNVDKERNKQRKT
jgi:hypothetical protein